MAETREHFMARIQKHTILNKTTLEFREADDAESRLQQKLATGRSKRLTAEQLRQSESSAAKRPTWPLAELTCSREIIPRNVYAGDRVADLCAMPAPVRRPVQPVRVRQSLGSAGARRLVSRGSMTARGQLQSAGGLMQGTSKHPVAAVGESWHHDVAACLHVSTRMSICMSIHRRELAPRRRRRCRPRAAARTAACSAQARWRIRLPVAPNLSRFVIANTSAIRGMLVEPAYQLSATYQL